MVKISKSIFTSIVLLLFFVYGYLLFKNLSHYPFWDDEANTALYARNLLQSGELNAFDGRNLLGYSNGIELNADLNNIIIPPFQYYITAISFSVFGENNFTARLPFALMGLLSFAFFFLIQRELFKNKGLILINMIIFTANVAFILYMRQCRYYAPTALFFLVNIYLLLRYFKSSNYFYLLAYFLSSFLLFISQYNAALAILFVLAISYGYAEQWKLKKRKVLAFILTNSMLLLAIGAFLYLNNPFENASAYSSQGFNLPYKFYVFYRGLLSFDRFAILSFPLVIFFFYFQRKQKNPDLKGISNLLLFFLLNLFVFSFFSVKFAARYIIYLFPVAFMIEGYVIKGIWRWPTKYARYIASGFLIVLILSSALFVSTEKEAELELLNIKVNSPLLAYVDEIHSEHPTNYSKLIDFLNSKTARNQKVAIFPVFMSCPLIYYTGNQYLFINQIGREKKIKKKLPEYVFNNSTDPDYLIICGPDIKNKQQILQQFHSMYEFAELIDFYYKDTTRPEFNWRHFDVYESYDPQTEAIYIFTKVI
ncbi:MAG: ArnT family glycosyltransferase [Prolixibacteraceae bacterium]